MGSPVGSELDLRSSSVMGDSADKEGRKSAKVDRSRVGSGSQMGATPGGTPPAKIDKRLAQIHVSD